MYENCDCNENDDKDDQFNRETCEWDCFANSKSMGSCIEDARNPYNDDEGQEDRAERFEAQEYAECKEWEPPAEEEEEDNQADEEGEEDNAERRRRKLEQDEEGE